DVRMGHGTAPRRVLATDFTYCCHGEAFHTYDRVGLSSIPAAPAAVPAVALTTIRPMATLERLGVGALRDTMTSFRDAVRAHAAAINRLNVYPVPDGDTGTN